MSIKSDGTVTCIRCGGLYVPRRLYVGYYCPECRDE